MGLVDLCPTRMRKPGPLPTMKSMRKPKEKDRYKHWLNPLRDPNTHEKRIMIVEAVRVCLSFIMTNHMYTFDNQMMRQQQGGPIGLDLTGTVAQIFMIWWEDELRRRLEDVQISLTMHKRYVDDINQALPAVAPGTKYTNGTVVIEASRDDVEADARTMRFIQSVANSIHRSIQVEVDYPSRYADKKMPILDLKVWVETDGTVSKIIHEHYMKDVSSKSVTFADSAMPWSNKRTILTQEGLRMLLNCSRELPWKQKAGHLSHLTARMQYSGYDKQFRHEVISSSISAYRVLRTEETEGRRPLYRPRGWNLEERRKKRLNKKKDWYKSGGKKAFIMIPYTKNSELKKEYTKCITDSGFPIQVVEKAGTSLKRKIQRSDPFMEKKCQRDGCFVCSTEGRGCCKTEGANYEIVCVECNATCYSGKTAGNTYTIGKEHQMSCIMAAQGQE